MVGAGRAHAQMSLKKHARGAYACCQFPVLARLKDNEIGRAGASSLASALKANSVLTELSVASACIARVSAF